MFLDLFSAVVGGIIGGLVGFMSCILMAMTSKTNRKPGLKAQKECEYFHDDCQLNCDEWTECDEWEG